jgi:hypothetical protein
MILDHSWSRNPPQAWGLCCVGRGLAIGPSPIQGDLPKCLNVFIVPEVNSDSEQARGSNP